MSDILDPTINRRAFLRLSATAGALAATGVPAAHASAAPLPHAALPHLPVAGRQLDSQEFCLSEYESITPSLGFSATDEDSARRWQAEARAKLVDLLGGFPEPVPLQPEVLETRDLGSYTREKIVFQTRRNLTAIGYLLLPKERAGRIPAIVCITGHGRGCDDIVGIEPDGTQRTEKTGYAKDFAIQAVEKGYAAFALEPLAFGHRRDAAARAGGPNQYSCRPAAGAAMLFGQTMIGWRVWDVMRTLDYLQTRPEVAADRVATMGISGGGTVSLFSGAVEERIRASVVSCYFNTFRDSIVSLSHCLDNYVPGLLPYMEMYDVAGLVAPRGLFVESGENDRIFPIAGARAAYERTAPIFRTLGAEDRLGREIFPGGHEFHGVGAFEFLGRVL
jgi:dienelactone hydrolase